VCVEQDAIKMASHGGIPYKELHKKLQFGTCHGKQNVRNRPSDLGLYSHCPNILSLALDPRFISH